MAKIKKQAILLLVHNNFTYIESLLKVMDSDYFDFFIHVDASVEAYDKIKSVVLDKSSCHFVTSARRINVRWGDFSIVEAELELLKLAKETADYSYYHLLSGADFVLKTPKQIFDFFDNSPLTEYINFFDIASEKRSFYSNRYHYKYTVKYPKQKSVLKKALYQIYIQLVQKLTFKRHTDREFLIGSQWFSITDTCVSYLLEKETMIYELFESSLVPDESFLQTLVSMNKELSSRIVEDADRYQSIKREIEFIDGKPRVWGADDFDYLMASDSFFTRKVNEGESDELIEKIVEKIRKESKNGY